MILPRIRKRVIVCFRKMSESLLSPVGVRGMKVLEAEKFLRNVQVPVLKVSEEKLGKVTHVCRPYFMKIDNFKPVQECQGEASKYIYLNPDKITDWTDISEQDRTSLSQHGVDKTNFQTKEVQLGYANFKFEDIFKAVLPEQAEIVSSFSQIGHIIHLNLREHLLEYKPLIGQVLVDKVKTCRTVVVKNNIIDNTFRNFNMEVIAGEEDYLVTVKENRCSFQFDFSKVYWNPRLCKEHERILDFVKPGDILFDVFCGVGPFSIPAAKQSCKVFANDLNPESYKWLNHNAKNNKVKQEGFKSYNLDGKDFICDVFKNYLIDYCKGKEEIDESAKIHVTMNLPALALKFINNFNGLLKGEPSAKFDREIIVYLYCFATGDNPSSIAKAAVIEHFGSDISSNIINIFDVRNVSPKKEMMRVTFTLTKDILFGLESETKETGEPPSKKLCVETDNENEK